MDEAALEHGVDEVRGGLLRCTLGAPHPLGLGGDEGPHDLEHRRRGRAGAKLASQLADGLARDQ